MRVLLVLIAACAPAVAPAPIENRVAGGPEIEAAIAPGGRGWWLAGSAVQVSSALELHFCCTAVGAAAHRLPALATPGHWTVAIEHANDDCTTGTLVFVQPRRDGPHSAFALGRLQADKRGGVTTLDFDVDEPQALDLVFGSEGGLECCGTTSITRIAIATRPESD